MSYYLRGANHKRRRSRSHGWRRVHDFVQGFQHASPDPETIAKDNQRLFDAFIAALPAHKETWNVVAYGSEWFDELHTNSTMGAADVYSTWADDPSIEYAALYHGAQLQEYYHRPVKVGGDAPIEDIDVDGKPLRGITLHGEKSPSTPIAPRKKHDLAPVIVGTLSALAGLFLILLLKKG